MRVKEVFILCCRPASPPPLKRVGLPPSTSPAQPLKETAVAEDKKPSPAMTMEQAQLEYFRAMAMMAHQQQQQQQQSDSLVTAYKELLSRQQMQQQQQQKRSMEDVLKKLQSGNANKERW